VDRNCHGLASEMPLSPQDRAREALIMGLRLREGVDLAQISARMGLGVADIVDHAAIARLGDQGLLTIAENRLIIAEFGILLLDALLAAIVN